MSVSTKKEAQSKALSDDLDVDAFLNSEASGLTRETEVGWLFNVMWKLTGGAAQMRRVLASFKLNPCKLTHFMQCPCCQTTRSGILTDGPCRRRGARYPLDRRQR